MLLCINWADIVENIISSTCVALLTMIITYWITSTQFKKQIKFNDEKHNDLLKTNQLNESLNVLESNLSRIEGASIYPNYENEKDIVVRELYYMYRVIYTESVKVKRYGSRLDRIQKKINNVNFDEYPKKVIDIINSNSNGNSEVLNDKCKKETHKLVDETLKFLKDLNREIIYEILEFLVEDSIKGEDN